MQIIKLQSSDNEIFDTDVAVAKCSGTIRKSQIYEGFFFKGIINKNSNIFLGTMLEDLGIDENNSEEEVVPLPNVNSAILRKVIQFCTYHKDDPTPPSTDDDENKEKRTDDITSWDADFLKVDQGTLFELILAANYLDIRSLLDVTCKTVANMIKGKTPDEIRKTFNIKNDFTPAEEEQVRKENTWCEEK
jgi:S-phase kinase-associated protein 1